MHINTVSSMHYYHRHTYSSGHVGHRYTIMFSNREYNLISNDTSCHICVFPFVCGDSGIDFRGKYTILFNGPLLEDLVTTRIGDDGWCGQVVSPALSTLILHPFEDVTDKYTHKPPKEHRFRIQVERDSLQDRGKLVIKMHLACDFYLSNTPQKRERKRQEVMKEWIECTRI